VAQAFESAEIVALVGTPELTETGGAKHKVKRVWKGKVGEQVYIAGWSSYPLVFASRSEANGPLIPIGGRCIIHVESEIALGIVAEKYGSGYLPTENFLEKPMNTRWIHWPIVLSMFFLTFSCVFAYQFVMASFGRKNA